MKHNTTPTHTPRTIFDVDKSLAETLGAGVGTIKLHTATTLSPSKKGCDPTDRHSPWLYVEFCSTKWLLPTSMQLGGRPSEVPSRKVVTVTLSASHEAKKDHVLPGVVTGVVTHTSDVKLVAESEGLSQEVELDQ